MTKNLYFYRMKMYSFFMEKIPGKTIKKPYDKHIHTHRKDTDQTYLRIREIPIEIRQIVA